MFGQRVNQELFFVSGTGQGVEQVHGVSSWVKNSG